VDVVHGRALWGLFVRSSSSERAASTSCREPAYATARYPGKSKENDIVGKIIVAVAGSKVAKHSSGMSGPFGAMAGVVMASALRKMSVPAMVALAAGGYFAKRAMDLRQNGRVRAAA